MLKHVNNKEGILFIQIGDNIKMAYAFLSFILNVLKHYSQHCITIFITIFCNKLLIDTVRPKNNYFVKASKFFDTIIAANIFSFK